MSKLVSFFERAPSHLGDMMTNRVLRGRGVLLAFALLLAGCATAARDEPPRTGPRGEYLVTIMDCGGCHTPGALAGNPDFSRKLAGSNIGFGIPGLGVVFPPNLTPDPDTGLGKWTDEQILRAIRHGQRPDGRILFPIMPWPSYGVLTDADARAVVEFLRSLPPVRQQVPPMAKSGEKPGGPYLTVVEPR